ncbi:putative plant self-incompatibility S1 [Helianthus anomalus]
MPNLLVIGVLVFISTFSCANSLWCFGTPDWHMFVINGMPNDVIEAHIYDTYDDHPKCDHCKLSPEQVFDWYFCPVDSLYHGNFTWGTKSRSVELYGKHISNVCFHYKFFLGTQHCYWLVKPEGFYVSRHNLSHSDPNWRYEGPWN